MRRRLTYNLLPDFNPAQHKCYGHFVCRKGNGGGKGGGGSDDGGGDTCCDVFTKSHGSIFRGFPDAACRT